MDDIFEIRDDEIDVEDIMRQIRENVKKRRESGAYDDEMEDIINKPLSAMRGSHSGNTVLDIDNDLSRDLEYINSNWDIHAEYHISSHKSIIGKFLVRGRQIVHGEVRRYVDLIVAKQIEFNAHVVHLMNKLTDKLENNVQELENKTTTIIDKKISNVFETINTDIENKAWLANLLDDTIQDRLEFIPPTDVDEVMNYYLFEEKHRGSTDDIKQRQSIFLGHFKNSQSVLDIGCGRGEFLSLLKENGIGAKGIDLNEDMILYCQKNGLDAIQGNALTYLQSLKDKSLDGVFSGQVVEHLQSDELISLVKQCYDKMKFGTYFVAETVNPTCLSVFAKSFYMDLSHVKPIHPVTIKFLMESVGFRDVEFKFFSPHPDEVKLEKFQVEDGIDDVGRRQLEVMNANIDKLNGLLYGYEDYAVIGKK